MFFLTASAYVLVAMTHYEGMLTSFMTTRLRSPRVKTFPDVVEFGYQVAVMNGSKQLTELEDGTWCMRDW